MNATLTPGQICINVAKNKLSKDVATELLISLIESPDYNIRIKTLEAFLDLALNSDKVLKIVENCLLSDENALVRSAAAKVIFKNFPKNKNYIPLKWASRYEKSAIVINTFFNLFDIGDPLFDFIKQKLLKRLERIYSIIRSEINLFLTLDVLYAHYAKEYDFIAGSAWFKVMKFLNTFPNTTGLIQRIYYLKLGGKKYLAPPDESFSYLKELILREGD
ncbi:MAG: HEAT repeat domain-containing protein [Promethearchaeota archaeon]